MNNVNQNKNELLQLRCNSALTTSANFDLVKPTYAFIETKQIVDRFERQGWQLENASQARVKNAARQGYQKHLLRFRNPGLGLIDLKDNASIPELVVQNSHDGTAALRICFGVFRIACLNGLIAGNGFGEIRVIHSQNSIKKLDDGIDSLTNNIPFLVDRVREFSQITLNDSQRIELARQIAYLRLNYVKNVVDVNLDALLTPRRVADKALDAYSVFNVIQEKAIRGGIQYKAVNSETNFVEKRTTRNISSIAQSVRLNRGMWDILENVVKAA